ncbi:unnamed protein product [Moneuplotes crassus]|uniref:Uncharacterized protein n=1 Tax=Euplotes crassus TaxID=5936 RepID=A0AAD1XTC1_EUPCR|nr:unnamed protein product [Moneuplotes crassus]
MSTHRSLSANSCLLIPFLSQVKIEDLKDDLSKDRTPQKEESKSTTSESQRAESIFMTPKTFTKTDSECKSSASSSAQIKKYSLAEILSVFKIMGNFSGISDTYENGQKSVIEKPNPGTLKLTRKIQDVLSISKPCYILENENAELTRLSTRTPLGQRTNLKTNPCNDLSLKFLHDLETELKHIGPLNILEEADPEHELDSDEDSCS